MLRFGKKEALAKTPEDAIFSEAPETKEEEKRMLDIWYDADSEAFLAEPRIAAVEVGSSAAKWFEDEAFKARFARMRVELTRKTGFPFPFLRVVENASAPALSYRILVRGSAVLSGESSGKDALFRACAVFFGANLHRFVDSDMAVNLFRKAGHVSGGAVPSEFNRAGVPAPRIRAVARHLLQKRIPILDIIGVMEGIIESARVPDARDAALAVEEELGALPFSFFWESLEPEEESASSSVRKVR